VTNSSRIRSVSLTHIARRFITAIDNEWRRVREWVSDWNIFTSSGKWEKLSSQMHSTSHLVIVIKPYVFLISMFMLMIYNVGDGKKECYYNFKMTWAETKRKVTFRWMIEYQISFHDRWHFHFLKISFKTRMTLDWSPFSSSLRDVGECLYMMCLLLPFRIYYITCTTIHLTLLEFVRLLFMMRLHNDASWWLALYSLSSPRMRNRKEYKDRHRKRKKMYPWCRGEL
jgi:hypothetical protein